jgi:polysaccharide deacetylase 2 family uncharacterized protein YibQ
MTRSKKPSKSRPKKPPKARLKPQILVTCGLLAAILLLGALLLWVEKQPRVSPPQRVAVATLAEVQSLVEQDLLGNADPATWERIEQEGQPVRLRVRGDYPASLQLMELVTRVALTNSPAQLDLAPRKGLVRLYWHGELRLELAYEPAAELGQQQPLVAIIMDDMGTSMEGFNRLLQLALPVTPAILPQTAYATRGAHLLKERGREFLIHLPMEPKNYPAANPGPQALMLNSSPTELARRLRLYQQKVPGAVGGNNHMGSGFTADREAMHRVLAEMKTAGLFFIDSRTIADSVAFDEARRMQVPSAQRNIFLDNQSSVAYISVQLRKMIAIAEEKGFAIAICHPHPETFEALVQNQQWLREQKVEFVAASRLVKVY